MFLDTAMNKTEAIAQAIKTLSPAELTAFREWLREFDAATWDRHLEIDMVVNKLPYQYREPPPSAVK